MMTELLAALQTLLRQAGLPVYLADCVPQGTNAPYVTLIAAPGAEGASSLTLWCTGCTAHAQRLALCDDFLTLIPAGGLHARLTDCAAVLTRAKNAAVTCRREADLLGMTIPLTLQLHPLARKEA